jgi:asparagine synthetase B (glutamine-hydrolysing)
MIGLFGTYHRQAERPADIAAMAHAIPDRYPSSVLGGSGAALGRASHRLDFGSSEAQSSTRRAVAMGTVHNMAAVAKAAGLTQVPTTVAELVAALAEAGKYELLTQANGLFCAAVYDAETHRLDLITDRLASWPVHVWVADGEVVFAGSILTLLADGRPNRRADPLGIAQLFTMQRTVGETTSVAGVRALPAGSVVTFDRDGEHHLRYWRLAWRRPDFDEREGSQRLAAAMRNAVARSISDGEAGLLLSGGFDSRLVLAAAPPGSLSCWTTASFAENPELDLARRTAAMFDAPHHTLIRDPSTCLLDVLDRTVVESNALYPASTPMSVFLDEAGADCDVLLSGHGLDYTLRGYYLPSRFLRFAGSRTRLPTLRPIPASPSGADVLRNLRQGPPLGTVQRIVPDDRQAIWWDEQAEALQAALGPWLESDNPYNAWDAFILHAVSKHYAFTSMMSVRAVAQSAMPAFDSEVFDIYLAMPPAWRCSGRMAKLAMRAVSTKAAALANANTGVAADTGPWAETGAVLGRAVLRRARIMAPPLQPAAWDTEGSWSSAAALYRHAPAFRAHLLAIRDRLDQVSLGLLSTDALASCIDEHLAGTAKHTKLLRQLMTHDSWVRQFGISGAA